MSKHLQRDLDGVKRELLAMGGLIERQTDRAFAALLRRDAALAADVTAADDEVDAREVELEEECLKLLALHQPVATDLRFIVTAMKVNNDLERMGDLAVNIGERAAFLAGHPPLDLPLDLEAMAAQVRSMVRDSLDALVNLDVAKARDVLARDDDVDRRHKEMFRVCQDLMQADPENVERAVATLSASRNLERIADLATNIAEDLVFLVEGEVIRHRYNLSDSE